MQSFNEKQVSAILKRATELQAGDEGAAHGLTLDELRSIAAEVGIDSRFVEQAAFETQRPAQKKAGFSFWGAPVRLTEERVLARPVDEDEWGAMVEEMRRVYGQVGTVSGVGGTRTWSYGGRRATTAAAVSLTQRRGRTCVTAQRNLEHQIGATFAPAGSYLVGFSVLVAAGQLFTLTPPFSFFAALALLLSGFFALRAVMGHIGWKEQRKMTDMLDRLEAIAGESEVLHEAPVASHEPLSQTAALPLPDFDEASEAIPDARVPRTRTR